MKLIRGIAIGLLVALIVTPPAWAQDDYFTDLEIDEIRGAQQISRRVDVLLQIAQVRLAELGLAELEQEVESTSGNSRITRTIVRILAPAQPMNWTRPRKSWKPLKTICPTSQGQSSSVAITRRWKRPWTTSTTPTSKGAETSASL